MAIRQYHMAVGIIGYIRFVGNQYNRLPHFIKISKYLHDFPGRVAVKIPCRFICHDNGGVIRTRCLWPPDISAGMWSIRSPSPTDSSIFTARSLRSFLKTFPYIIGRITLSRADRRGSRLKLWKTNPIFLFLVYANSLSVRLATSFPSNL